MTVLVLVALNVAVLAVAVRALLLAERHRRATALPHWPDSLDLPIPGLGSATRSRRP